MKQKLLNTSVVLAWIHYLPPYTKLLAVTTAKNNQHLRRTLNSNCSFNHFISTTSSIIKEEVRYIMEKIYSDQSGAINNNLLIKVL